MDTVLDKKIDVTSNLPLIDLILLVKRG